MTIAVVRTDNVSYLYPSSNMGHGQEAAKIEELLDEILKHVRQSGPFQLTDEALFEIYKEHSEENWDGEAARAITKDAYIEAREFLRLLPSTVPTPEIVPEPTGEIAMEWYKRRDQVFIVSFAGRGMITFAGMFGQNTTIHGTESFEDFIPTITLESIRRLFPLQT